MNFVELEPSKRFLLRLKQGDEILSSLKTFCKEKDIYSASIFAIGAISRVDLALYKLDKKEYLKKSFSGAFEIASMSGNITKLNNEYIAHIHGVYSDEKFGCIAGHVDSATVSATCEIVLEAFENKISRKNNAEIGLNLLDL